jgi:hypothetical protein
VPARWIEDHAYPSDAAVCAAVDSVEQEVLTVVAIPGSARV